MGSSDSSFPFRHPFVLAWIAGDAGGGARLGCTLTHLSLSRWIGAGVEQGGRVDFLLAVPYPAPSNTP